MGSGGSGSGEKIVEHWELWGYLFGGIAMCAVSGAGPLEYAMIIVFFLACTTWTGRGGCCRTCACCSCCMHEEPDSDSDSEYFSDEDLGSE